MAKVAASSLRRGSVVDMDGKLYVVLSIENIHPGKGTPVTQLDMRRIADGVKVSERYRTTEQVERAFVDQRDHTFLYQDGEGFHFMNPENYDQFVAPTEMVGDLASYRARYQLPYTIGFDGSGDVLRAYKVYALPTQFFIDTEGRIVQVVNGPVDEAGATALIESLLPPGASPSVGASTTPSAAP